MFRLTALAGLLLFPSAALAGGTVVLDHVAAKCPAPIVVSSGAIGPDGHIAARNTAYGQNLSLPVSWPAIAGTKAKIGRSARSVHQEAIQLHGAIGTTAELSLGAYAKRLVAYEMLFGATHEHLARYGALIARPELAAEGLLS